VYFYKLSEGELTQTGKMNLLKWTDLELN